MRKRKREVSLSAMLAISIGGLCLFVILALAQMFISMSKRNLMSSAQENSRQVVSQASDTIEITKRGMEKDLENIISGISTLSFSEDIQNQLDLSSGTRNDIAAIFIFNKEGNILHYGANGKTLKSGAGNLSFNKGIYENADKYIIMEPHVQNVFAGEYPWVVTVARQGRLKFYPEEVYIAVDFQFSSLASYVDNIKIGQRGYCFIMDERGEIVYHPQQQVLFAGMKQEDAQKLSRLKDGVHPQEDVIYAMETLESGDWRIVGVSYTSEMIDEQIGRIASVVFAIAFAGILLSAGICIVFSRILSRPIRNLAGAMQEFETDVEKFDYQMDSRISEVSSLSSSFAHMVYMIRELINKVKTEEISLRKTELKALQAQINPHFLYNTLDSIQWMCEQEKTKDAVKMVGALARLFRISISRGKELIPIIDEINHAKSYLVIQSYRYKNQFTYEFIVDETILDYLCNKITLQPILENAIYHGIGRMVDEGKVTVIAKREENDIVFSVEDNGAGMTKEQCESILKKERSDSSGIGIKNVNDRIKIFFGDEYGIWIESELDVGTTITIRFPIIKEAPDETK